MPVEPNQRPYPGQRKPISTARVQSTIPKGGTNTTWLYPSPQMFYNGARGIITYQWGGWHLQCAVVSRDI